MLVKGRGVGATIAVRCGMHHLVAHAVCGTFLFHDWLEAGALWNRLSTLQGLRAAVVMPDHVHVLISAPDRRRWFDVLRGYARWRNAHRGLRRARVWLPFEAPEPIKGFKHLRRTIRYIHLNPCRDHLVVDPLGWPFSTHRDSTGLAIPSIIRPEKDPQSFHSFISSDPSVAVKGTPFPRAPTTMLPPTPGQVITAVSAVTRTPLPVSEWNGTPRALLVKCLKVLARCSVLEIATMAGISRGSVWRACSKVESQVFSVQNLLGDARFAAIHKQALPGCQAWRRYSQVRERRGVYEFLERNAMRRRQRDMAWRKLQT